MKFRFSIPGIVAALLCFSPLLVKGQTTVTYTQQTGNYYTFAPAGQGGGTYNQGSFQVGMYANSTGAKQAISFRKFRTDGSGSSTGDRAMQVGDVFTLRFSATRAYGRIGFALLASPSATTAWADRENNYALSVNLDGPLYLGGSTYGNWYVKYNGGATSSASFGGQAGGTYNNFTCIMTLTAPNRMNIALTNNTSSTTSNFYDVQLNNSNPITDYSIYLEDDYDGSVGSKNVYWGQGVAGTQHEVTNNGVLSHGQSAGSYTVSGVMTNGLDANSASTNSLNNALTKIGAGTLTLSGANTYVGTTTVTAGTLQLGAAGVIADASNVVLSGGVLSTGSGAGFSETMGTLSVTANSTIALGTGNHTINFANSSATTFTSGTLLTITGWTGTNNGNSSGTAGKIFFGSSAGTLTGLQLSRIRFNISAVNYGAMQLNTGEIVPSGGQVLYYGGVTGTWTGSLWGTAEGGPYTTAWTSGRHAIFNIASGTLTMATTNVAAITYNENITNSAGGTLGFGPSGGGIAPIYVASGKLLNFAGQTMSVAAGTGLIKNGPGTLQQNGAAFTGGFTLNDGMFAAGGVNSMGAGGALTINSGIIGLTATRDFTGKFTGGITIGGDFTLGSATSPSVTGSNATFTNNTALGSSVTRTITLGGTGSYTWNGIISGTSSNLTLDATAAGNLLLGGVNTYGGNTTINGGTLRPTVAGGLPSTTGLSFANTSGANLNLQTDALSHTVVSLSGGGSTGGNISFGAATTTTLTVNQTSNTTYSGLISGASLTTGGLIKTNTGTLTLGHTANTYTGTTTITGGELRINPSTTTGTFASQIVLNGGKLSTTGIATSTVMTSSSTLNLNATSTLDLGSNAHDLKFANSSGVAWAGTTLTINGWTGTGGVSGTAGRIFFGSAAGTLTGTQLGKIVFNGYAGTPILLGTGELVPSVAGTNYTWNGSASGAWTTNNNWTPNTGFPGASDNVTIPTSGSYTNALAVTGSQNCFDFTVNGTGTFSMGAGESLTIGGTYSYGSSVPATFNCTSSLAINGTASSTIPAVNYGNLDLAGGPRLLANSGTIGICGTFSRGAGAYTVTGSTVDYNGTGAQTIAVGTYNNLTISNARGSANLTSPSGTISVAGTFDVSTLSAFTPVVNAASIFDFTSAGAQPIPSFFYGQLNNTGNGNRTWDNSGIIDINQGFTPGSGTHTITGSTIQYSNPSATTWNLSTFTTNVASRQYNNLIFNGGTSTIWSQNGITLGVDNDLTITSGTLIVGSSGGAGTLNIDGDWTINGANATLNLTNSASNAGTINLFGDFVQSAGAFSKSAAGTGIVNFALASGTQTINQTAGTITNNGTTWNLGTGATTQTVQLLSNWVLAAGTVSPKNGTTVDFQTFVLSGTTTFTTVGGTTLMSASTNASGCFTTGVGTGSVQSSGTRTYAVGISFYFDGAGDQFTGNAVGTSNQAVNKITINTTSGASVTLTKPSGTYVQITNTVNLISGILKLDLADLQLQNAATFTGSPWTTANMVVNSGSSRYVGRIVKVFPNGPQSGLTFTYPLGDITGTVEYSPVDITNLSYTTASSPYLDFKVFDGKHPNDPSINDYLTRYWQCNSDFPTSSGVTMNANFNYLSADVVGTEGVIKMNRYYSPTGSWTEDAASSAGSNVLTSKTLTGSASPAPSEFDDHDIVGRLTVPLYYRSASAGPNIFELGASWIVSTDPAFLSPTGVAATTYPTYSNSAGIRIMSGHSMTVSTLAGVDDMTIESGGTLTLASSMVLAFYVNNGTGTDLTVDGTIVNQSAFAWTLGGTVQFNNGALYDHNVAIGTVPAVTWVVGSECKISGAVNSAPSGLAGQTFSDFTWDCNGQLSSFSLSGNLTTVGRDLKITNTGGSGNYLGFTSTTTLAMTVGRDLYINGGYAAFATGTLPASSSLAVTRDVLISSGAFNMSRGNANTTSGISSTIGRNLDISGSGQFILAAIGSSGAGALTVTVTGTTTNTSSVIGLWITGSTKNATLTSNGLFTHSGTSIHMNSVTTGVATLNANAGFTMTSGIFIVAGGTGGVGNLNIPDNQTLTLSGGTLTVATSTGTGNVNMGTNTTSATTTAMTISGGTLEVTGGTGTVNNFGNLNLTSGSMTRTAGTAIVNFLAQGTFGLWHSQTITQGSATVSGAIAFNAGATGTFSILTLGSNVNLGTGSTTTVTGFTAVNFSYLDFATYTLSGLNFTQSNFGVMVTAHADGFWTIGTGLTTGSLRTTNTRNLNANGNFTYNGTVAQVTGDAVTSALNFSVFNSTAGLTLSNNLAITAGGTFYLNFFGLHGKLSLSTFNLTIASTGNIAGASSTDYIVTNSTGQLKRTVAASSVDFPVGLSAYNPIRLFNSGTSDIYGVIVIDAVTSPVPYDDTKLINRFWNITEAVAGSSTLTTSMFMQYNGGEENANFAAGSVLKIGYYNGVAWNAFAATQSGSDPYTVAPNASFSPAVASYTLGIGKDDGFLSPSVNYTWNGGTSSSWATPGNWTPNGNPNGLDNITIPDVASYTNELIITGARTANDFLVSANGKYTMGASSTLSVGGTYVYSSSTASTYDCSSTLNLLGSGGINVPAADYGILNLSGGGARTLPSSGTVGICGTYTPGSSMTITGSTVNYNATGAQTITATPYVNLTISNARSSANLTSPAGTITVSGTFNVSTLSAYTPVVNAASIFDFTGSGQTIPAFYYGQLNNSVGSNRTLASSGIVDIAQGFTPASGTTTISGSSVRYSNTDPVTWNLTSFTSNVGSRQYNNLELVGGASTAWQLASGLNLGVNGNFVLSGAGKLTVAVNATANTMTVDGNMTLSGPGNIIIANTGTATLVNAFTVAGNTTISSGLLTGVGSSSSTTVQGNFTTNDLTISGTGAMNLDAASNTAFSTVTINGNTSITSTATNPINLGSGGANANNIINVKGNFTKSGTGVLGLTGTYNATAQYIFNGVGTQQLSHSGAAMTGGAITISSGSSVQLQTSFATASSANPNFLDIAGTLDCQGFVLSAGNAANTFRLQAGATLITGHASGVSGSISGFTNANTTWTVGAPSGGANFVFNGNNVNTGFSSYANIQNASASNSYNLTWSGTGNITLDKTMYMNNLAFTSTGLFNLGSNSLTLSSVGTFSGAPFSVSKMFVVTTGNLIRSVQNTGTGLPFTWPIGETTGTTEYSPVTVTSISGAGVNGTIGFGLIDGVHPDLALATSYLSRYWPCNVTGFNVGYTLSGLTFDYNSTSGDIVVGPEASLKANSYNSTTTDWTQYAASSAGSGVLTITSGVGGTNMPTAGTYDITGRIDVPVYYRTVSGGSWSTPGIWEISSSPSFGSLSTPVNPPTTANSDSVLIRNTHTVNVNSIVAADEVFVKTGGVLNITTSGTYTLPNGLGAVDMRVDGQLLVATPFTISASAKLFVPGLVRQTVSSQITNSGTIQYGATGTYEHQHNAGTIPAATWDAGSTCILKNITATAPTGLGQTFSNFTVDCPTLVGSLNTLGGLTTVNGNFTLISTNSGGFRLTASTNYTLAVGGNIDIQANSFLDFSSSGGTCVINVTGDVLMASTSQLTRTGSSSDVTFEINGTFNQSGGTFDVAGGGAGGGSMAVNFKGDVVMNGPVLRTRSGVYSFNFIKASGTQTLSQGSAITTAQAILWNFGNGTTTNTTQLLTDVNVGTSGNSDIALFNSSTLDFQDKIILGSNGDFVMGATATVKLGSQYGITTATPGATSGNIQTMAAGRSVSATGTFIYTGTVNQNTGNLLPTTLTGTGKITIANTGTAGNNTVTLTTNNTTTPQLNLNSGLFAIGSGNTLIISSGGTVNATSGDFATGSTGGMVRFVSTGGSFTGTCNPFSVETNGACGINFGSGPVAIQSGGVFNINSGGYVTGNAPAYSSGSSLWYLTGAGAYGRGLEWSTTSGKGYPHHVVVSGASNVLSPARGDNSYANVPFQCAGNLTINSGASIYMDNSGNNMTEDLRVLGNLNLVGNLSGSGTPGSDIFIGGNWTNNGVATTNFFPNGRQVSFNGNTAQTIGGSNTTVPAFDYLAISNTSGDVTTNKSLTANNRLQMNSGKLIIGNNNITIGASGIIDLGDENSYIVTNGTGYVSQTVNGGDDWYPVGPSTSAFGPVTLNQSGTGETINVRVINVAGIAAPSYTNAVNDTTQMVKMEWVMNESVSGANSLRTTFGWQGAGTAGASNIEGSGFDRTSAVYHGNYNGTKYVVRTTNTTSGSNPYYSVCTVAQPFTGTMAANQRFVVGNIIGILPCLQTSFAGDWNTASNWVDLIVPPTGSAVCINHAMTLAAAPPNPGFVTVNSPNGDITISPGISLTLEPSGTFTNNKAGFNMTSGSVVFQSGTSTINGSQAAGFNNLQLNGNTTLTTAPTINNELEIKAGGFIISANGPNYGSSSTLKYNTGGSYNRSNEWRATSGTGFPANVLVTGNTDLNLDNGTGVNRTIQGNMQVDNGSSVTQGATGFNLTVPGNFTLNGAYTQSTTSGGDLILGGNWNSGATATLTSNNRDVRFNGSSSTQTIANTSVGLEFGYLTIDNTSTGVDLLNTITANTFRVNPSRTFNLSSAKIIISPGGNMQLDGTFNANTGTIEYTDGGNFTNTGTFNRGTSTVNFLGTSPGTVVGTVQTNFHNIYLAPNGGANFNTGPIRGRVSGTLEIRAGSYVTNAPIYEPGSTLKYNGGGTYNRTTEWDPSTVQNVELDNNTTLYCGFNGTTFTHTMAGNLTVNTGSTYDMTSNNLANMTAPTQVGGNLVLTGTLKLSNSVGGDLEVGGDFTNNAGTFTCNDRLTTFNGTANASIAGSTNTNFCLMTVNKSSGATLTASVPFTSSLAAGTIVRVQGGTFDLNGQAITLGGGTNRLRVDAGFTNGQTLKTGGTSIGSFNTYTNDGVTTATLGGKVDYSSGSSETLTSGVTTYNMLWVTGAATKSITQTTTATGDVNIDPSTILDFGATASILNAQADVINAGTTTGSFTGKMNLNGSVAQNVSGSGTFRNLDVNNSNDVNSVGVPTITGKLNVILGKVLQASPTDSIILGSSATITETVTSIFSQHFVRGKLSTTRTVGVASETFGGIGVELTAGSNLGTVIATRQSGLALAGDAPTYSGFSGILRNWVIKPTVQPASPDRDLTLTWHAQDDNGLDMSLLQLWKRSSTASPWIAIAPVQDVSATNPRVAMWSGVSSFSQFTGADLNNPLPVSLLSFTGRNERGNAVLNWRTATEKENSGYDVMKSTDGVRFEKIGFVAGKGNSNSELSYNFTDLHLKVGSYYQLIQRDADGTTSASNKIYISTKVSSGAELVIYPNPGTTSFSFILNGLEQADEVLTAEIYGIDGKRLYRFEGRLTEMNQQVSTKLSGLAAGMYHVKATIGGEAQNLKWVKE